ncbi:MAG: TlpA family protein disulfide reductase [Zoogloeaceae bacterium]|jgi:peroxiredoxin|nr:TlpA family protein disulfide reductase [Zoogloeaceae bacterium]
MSLKGRRALCAFLAMLAFGASATDRASQSGASAQDAALRRLFAHILPDSQGKPASLATWRGQMLVVNFWATWCVPCREELPAFSRVQAKFQGLGVQFVGIALDSADKVRQFSRKYPVVFPLLIDAQQDLMTLMADLGNPFMGLPFTLLIDRQGRIVARKPGRLPERELLQWMAPLSREQDKTAKAGKNGKSRP